MKKLAFGLMAAVVLFASGCVERGLGGASSSPILRLYFVGTTKLGADTNATRLHEVLGMPSTASYRTGIFDKLARLPHTFARKSLPSGVADQSTLVRPLLDDLWNNESYLELRGAADKPNLLIASQLDDERARLWSTNLAQLAAAWKLGSPGSAQGGWRAAKDFTIEFSRSGKWTLAALTHDKASGLGPWAQEIARTGRPAPAADRQVLEFNADFPRLGGVLPVLQRFKLPPVQFKVIGNGEYVRTEGKFLYSDRLPIKLEPWNIPTNLVTDPIISFTCAQGIAPLLNQIKGYSQLGIKNPPNQYCMWGMATVHAQTFFTVPMPNATNVMREIAPHLPTFVNGFFAKAPGNFLWISNRSEWIWNGLPIVVPLLHPERQGDREYLYGGFFPPSPSTNPAPPELFAQVFGRTNLVYYDWEITQERLPHARHMFQLMDIITQRRLLSTNVPSQRWLVDLVPKLGNCVTEVTLTSPKELSFVRKSHLGLTGFELVLLSRWMDSPGFPLTYEPPPHVSVRTNRPPRIGANQLPGATNTLPATGTNRAPATNAAPTRPPSAVPR